MPDDIFEIKPGIYGFKLNVRALFRRLTQKARTDPIAAVARRFLQLFQDHGVPIAQIPHLIPGLTLDKLRTVEALLPALTPGVLDRAANLFRVRQAWLESASESIYDTLWCYKRPQRFFEDIAATRIKGVLHPIRALFSNKTLNMRDSHLQPMALLLLEKVADLGDEEVLQYRIYCDQWDWGHWKCRIQLKAMARLVDKHLCFRIPLYRTSLKTLEDIRSGLLVPPASVFSRPSDDISLEDFALNSTESARSKDAEEFPVVLDYISNNNLDSLARRAWRNLRK